MVGKPAGGRKVCVGATTGAATGAATGATTGATAGTPAKNRSFLLPMMADNNATVTRTTTAKICLGDRLIFCYIIIIYFLLINYSLYSMKNTILPNHFNSLPASVKLNHHVSIMKSTKYANLPTLNPDFVSLTKLVDRTALSQAFLNDTDERVSIQGKFKPIHTEGVSAPVVFAANKTKYTGLYKSGFTGILRLSRAVNTAPLTYGLGLKALVDGKPSVNFHAMYSLDGQGNYPDFFANTFTTHVEPPERNLLKVLAFFFKRAIPFISNDHDDRPVDETFIPLIESAKSMSDGNEVSQPVAPSKLLFVPKVHTFTPDTKDFRSVIMEQIPALCALYDVFDEDKLLLGTIRVMDEFIASKHGDEMHFKHQRISKDSKCPVHP